MKFIWNDNPMRTSVVLDDADRRLLRALVEVEELRECIGGAHLDLDPEWRQQHSKTEDSVAIQNAIMCLRYEWIEGEAEVCGKTFAQHVDDRTALYARELESGVHDGDCTCVACSCLKCHAERLAGIDTIGGLTKGMGHAIAHRFAPGKTSADVVAELRAYAPNPNDCERLRAHHDRWVADARAAADWLERYRSEKLGAA